MHDENGWFIRIDCIHYIVCTILVVIWATFCDTSQKPQFNCGCWNGAALLNAEFRLCRNVAYLRVRYRVPIQQSPKLIFCSTAEFIRGFSGFRFRSIPPLRFGTAPPHDGSGLNSTEFFYKARSRFLYSECTEIGGAAPTILVAGSFKSRYAS